MNEDNRYRNLKHIREIFNDIKRAEELKNNPQAQEELKSVQTIFLYINGDPEYIRKIYLN